MDVRTTTSWSCLALVVVTVVACSETESPDVAKNPTDGGSSEASGPAVDAQACAPPSGAACPPTAGNCLGIGTPCTKGGGECKPLKKQCDLDLDARGQGFCLSLLECEPGKGACGAGATCCKSASTIDLAVCLPNQCLPADCKAE